MWTPIDIKDLNNLILKGELELDDSELNFWDLIKIEPEKWNELEYGKEGGGFWVVAIFGREVIWYNDIEEGFNISTYKKYGEIREYACNQADLDTSVVGVMERIRANRF